MKLIKSNDTDFTFISKIGNCWADARSGFSLLCQEVDFDIKFYNDIKTLFPFSHDKEIIPYTEGFKRFTKLKSLNSQLELNIIEDSNFVLLKNVNPYPDAYNKKAINYLIMCCYRSIMSSEQAFGKDFLTKYKKRRETLGIWPSLILTFAYDIDTSSSFTVASASRSEDLEKITIDYILNEDQPVSKLKHDMCTKNKTKALDYVYIIKTYKKGKSVLYFANSYAVVLKRTEDTVTIKSLTGNEATLKNNFYVHRD